MRTHRVWRGVQLLPDSGVFDRPAYASRSALSTCVGMCRHGKDTGAAVRRAVVAAVGAQAGSSRRQGCPIDASAPDASARDACACSTSQCWRHCRRWWRCWCRGGASAAACAAVAAACRNAPATDAARSTTTTRAQAWAIGPRHRADVLLTTAATHLLRVADALAAGAGSEGAARVCCVPPLRRDDSDGAAAATRPCWRWVVAASSSASSRGRCWRVRHPAAAHDRARESRTHVRAPGGVHLQDSRRGLPREADSRRPGVLLLSAELQARGACAAVCLLRRPPVLQYCCVVFCGLCMHVPCHARRSRGTVSCLTLRTW